MKEEDKDILKKPYDNCKIYHPDGTLMFFSSQKKALWYLDRNLATRISDNEYKLTFVPKGYGDPETILEGRTNSCVIDNSIHNLTRHHVIPTQFRKHFPLKYKDKNSFDIVILTRENHDAYEIHANEFRIQLENDYLEDSDTEIRSDWHKTKSLYRTINYHFNKLPDDKQVFVQMQYDGFMERYNFDINNFDDKITPYTVLGNEIKIIDEIGIENFIVLWKLHFIKYGKPKYLPDWWKPNLIKIINKATMSNIDGKTELVEIDLVKNKKLLKLIFKYNLYDVARLYI